MLVDEVIERLKTKVDLFEGRVDGAASWSAVTAARSLPQRTPCAFVLPLGCMGGEVNAISGIFRQAVTTTIGVLILMRSIDMRGEKGLPRLEPVIDAVHLAISGWEPEGEVDCFALRRSELIASLDGTLVYQIDFSLQQQMRITS